MKDRSILISIGILIYIAISGINRFVYPIPDGIYIPVLVFGIVLILAVFLKSRK